MCSRDETGQWLGSKVEASGATWYVSTDPKIVKASRLWVGTQTHLILKALRALPAASPALTIFPWCTPHVSRALRRGR
jgi:hypothetical protein